MNRSDLRTVLRDELKTDPSGKIWRDRELDRFLRSAYQKVQVDMGYCLPENEVDTATLSTVSGTQEYDLPADFGQMANVRDTSGGTLTKRTKKKIEKSYMSGGTNLGTPSCYYIRGAKIGLFPIPNSVRTYSELYNALLVMADDDTAEIDFTDIEVQTAIIKHAAYQAWSSPRGNKNTALEKLDDYNEVLNSLKIRYQFRDQNIDYKVVREPVNNYNPQGLNI